MLTFVDQYLHMPILSIRGGRRISMTVDPILDPHKMKVLGFYAEDRASGVDKILLLEDIREFSSAGLIVDSEESLVEPSDLVRLEEILDLNFHLLEKRVVTESGKKIGSVENYAMDDTSFRIEKIYARPTAMKALSTNDFIISRRQIAGVTNSQVIVKDAVVKDKKAERSRRTLFGTA